MDGRALREWRKHLGFTQEEAAKHLDVTRATIQNWEYGITSLPGAIHFACQECVRRWKQRPDFGPVLLVYTDGLIWPPTTNLISFQFCIANLIPIMKLQYSGRFA